jgi:hypothetical protein
VCVCVCVCVCVLCVCVCVCVCLCVCVHVFLTCPRKVEFLWVGLDCALNKLSRGLCRPAATVSMFRKRPDHPQWQLHVRKQCVFLTLYMFMKRPDHPSDSYMWENSACFSRTPVEWSFCQWMADVSINIYTLARITLWIMYAGNVEAGSYVFMFMETCWPSPQ